MNRSIATKLFRATVSVGTALVLIGCLLGQALAQDPAHVESTTNTTVAVPAPGQAQNGDTGVNQDTSNVLPEASARLPRDLSPWGMFLSADIVVKIVMIGLALASVVTWTVALAKGLELFAAKRRLRAEIRPLAQALSLSDATRDLKNRGDVATFVHAAITELRMSAGATDKAGLKERVGSRLERIEASTGRRMSRGTGLLATIGATAPFVGLSGTVWGIMNSFIGISKQHTTNLAVVAPGIAEALLATALGLVAAIPAVILYNMFSRSIAGYRALQADAAAEVMRLLSRDLDRQGGQLSAQGRTLSAAE